MLMLATKGLVSPIKGAYRSERFRDFSFSKYQVNSPLSDLRERVSYTVRTSFQLLITCESWLIYGLNKDIVSPDLWDQLSTYKKGSRRIAASEKQKSSRAKRAMWWNLFGLNSNDISFSLLFFT